MNRGTSKLFVILFVFTVVFLLLTLSSALASSWSASNLSQNATNSVYPSVAADMNGNLHAVWRDVDASENQEIYYRKFSAATGTWSTARNISNTPSVSASNLGISDQPSVAADKYGNVHVVWRDYLNGNMDIYYVKYSSASSSWGSRVNISNTFTTSQSPSVVSDQVGNLYAVWEDGGNIYYARNAGGTWDAPQPLASAFGREQKPKVAVDRNGKVSVVWQGDVQDPFDPNRWYSEIFFNQSTDGTTWNPSGIQQLSASSPSNSTSPAIAVDMSNKIYAVWESGNEIYLRKSLDGLSWDPVANLSNTATVSNQPAVAGDRVGNVHLVWLEYAANAEIYYRKFSGSAWESTTNISNTTGLSRMPTIIADAAANPKVVWEDDSAYPNVAFDVYYAGLSGPILIYSTGFEGGPLPGWSFADAQANSGLDYWGQTNITGAAYSGSYGLWCAAVGTNSIQAGSPLNISTSPRIYDKEMYAQARLSVDLTLYQSATLSFYYKLPSLDSPTDVGWLYVRTAAGGFLKELRLYNASTTGWQLAQDTAGNPFFDLSEFAGQPIILEWVWVSDADTDVGEGMYIDNVTVTGMPLSVMTVSPNVRSNDKAYTITITGTGFKATPAVTIGATSASAVTRVDATKLTVTVPSGLAYGTYDITATNPSGTAATLYYGYKVSIPGDVNGDRTVNILDLVIVGKAFGSTPSSSNWNANADINQDGFVNILDLVIVGRNFGRTV